MRRLWCVLLTLLATVIFPVTQAAHAAQAPAPDMAVIAAVRIAESHAALTRPASPVQYRVRPGDTLSSVSGRFLGTGRAWPDLWWANRATVHDPNELAIGTILTIPSWHPVPPPGWLMRDALRAAGAVSGTVATTAYVRSSGTGGFPSYGIYSFSMLEQVWIWAGGPADVAWAAATIAECESGGKTWAKNPSSPASGLWQILGVPWPGNPFDGPTNARMAVTKFRDAGGFSPWVCQA